ncbi:hypothetical protein, conserved [Entamoeba dispar SAW760]|uniref:HD domain-containing protein n=2 Tax=Entamoeba dispar (strain ATCC PRA-260 / SAW760) TaxID=370354 RepID=B0EUZ0_ENTDS|nr:uncharacterized protein EDI_242320 [Entamoeba dispar SAW760]EDR21651.1 hypothetical protein, conserved [Entamoeba dispar SAW760]|eukprot:EDR21651.1 hypothetical protein, conserved [Entamoeba dispar SAW760]
MIHSKCETPIDPFKILEKYYKELPIAKHILIEHGKSIYCKCEEVNAKHLEYHINMEFIKEVAYLHDIGIFLVDSPQFGCNGKEPYIKHGILGANILRELGLEYHARVAERHTGSGIDPTQIVEQHLPLPTDRILLPNTIEEKLLCYADKFFSKSHLEDTLTHQMIREKLQKHGNDVIQRLDDLFKMFD